MILLFVLGFSELVILCVMTGVSKQHFMTAYPLDSIMVRIIMQKALTKFVSDG